MFGRSRWRHVHPALFSRGPFCWEEAGATASTHHTRLPSDPWAQFQLPHRVGRRITSAGGNWLVSWAVVWRFEVLELLAFFLSGGLAMIMMMMMTRAPSIPTTEGSAPPCAHPYLTRASSLPTTKASTQASKHASRSHGDHPHKKTSIIIPSLLLLFPDPPPLPLPLLPPPPSHGTGLAA